MTQTHTQQQLDISDNSASFLGRLKLKLPAYIAVVSLVSIAMGQFNDTMEAAAKIYDFGYSTLTDQPSRNKLERIYIRASSSVLDQTFGAPVYIKQAGSENEVKYYSDRNFILSAITKNDAIAAFLVFPHQDFVPPMAEHAGGGEYLTRLFSQLEETSEYFANVARTGNYYIEETTGGKFGLLYSSVGGVSEYIAPFSPQELHLLAELNDAQIMEEDTHLALSRLRAQLKPNFYGYSTVDFTVLEQAILSNSEYSLITRQ